MRKEVKMGQEAYVPYINLDDPNHPQNHGKHYIEVRMKKHPDGSLEKCIFIDGEHLDYSIDITDFWKACKMGYKRDAQISIVKHFIKAVSETIGRKVTLDELIASQRTNWI